MNREISDYTEESMIEEDDRVDPTVMEILERKIAGAERYIMRKHNTQRPCTALTPRAIRTTIRRLERRRGINESGSTSRIYDPKIVYGKPQAHDVIKLKELARQGLLKNMTDEELKRTGMLGYAKKLSAIEQVQKHQKIYDDGRLQTKQPTSIDDAIRLVKTLYTFFSAEEMNDRFGIAPQLYVDTLKMLRVTNRNRTISKHSAAARVGQEERKLVEKYSPMYS